MARPESTRNRRLRPETVESGCHCPVAATMAARTARMTSVLNRVAKSELTSATPTLAKIAVRAAKTAESAAQACQESKRPRIGLALG